MTQGFLGFIRIQILFYIWFLLCFSFNQVSVIFICIKGRGCIQGKGVKHAPFVREGYLALGCLGVLNVDAALSSSLGWLDAKLGRTVSLDTTRLD